MSRTILSQVFERCLTNLLFLVWFILNGTVTLALVFTLGRHIRVLLLGSEKEIRYSSTRAQELGENINKEKLATSMILSTFHFHETIHQLIEVEITLPSGFPVVLNLLQKMKNESSQRQDQRCLNREINR